MMFVLPVGRAGPLGDSGVVSGPTAGAAGGGAASGPAGGALAQKEVTEHAIDEGAKGTTFWVLVQKFGPNIVEMMCQMIMGAASGGAMGGGSVQDQQVSAATASLKQGDPGAFAAGSGSGAGSSSSFPVVPVAMAAVGLSLFGIYFFTKKKG